MTTYRGFTARRIKQYDRPGNGGSGRVRITITPCSWPSLVLAPERWRHPETEIVMLKPRNSKHQMKRVTTLRLRRGGRTHILLFLSYGSHVTLQRVAASMSRFVRGHYPLDGDLLADTGAWNLQTPTTLRHQTSFPCLPSRGLTESVAISTNDLLLHGLEPPQTRISYKCSMRLH